MVVVQDVVDQAATLEDILVVTHLVATQVATQVATLQGVGEVQQLLLSGQALGLPMGGHMEGPMEGPMEGLLMEGLMEGGPTVHTPLGLLALCVAEA